MLLAVACGGSISVAAFFTIRQLEVQRAYTEFDRRVEQHTALLQGKIDTYEEMLLALRNFQIYAEPVNREEFHGMAGDYLVSHPEIHSLQWIPRVTSGQRAAVEAEVRADGFPRFEFTEGAAGGGRVRAAVRPEYFPTVFIEPIKGNEAVLGSDRASVPSHRTLLEKARDSGEISISGRTGLGEQPAESDLMLVAIPVYRGNPAPATVELRRQLLAGFVLGVLRIHPLVEDALGQARTAGMDLWLLDRSAPATDQVMHHHSARGEPGTMRRPLDEAAVRKGPHREFPISVGGRQWAFIFRPEPAWLVAQNTWNPYGALISGSSFTLLLAAHLLAAVRRAETISILVQKQTADLRETNARLEEESRERKKAIRAIGKSTDVLRATLESTGDGILVVGPAGKIESYNTQFRQMWGIPQPILAAGDGEQAIAYVLQGLKAPEAFLAKMREVHAGGEINSFDVLELQDGRIFERYSQPQIIEGRAAGRVWSFRDVTERQRAAEALRVSEKKFRDLVETSQDLIWSVDAEGRWTFINTAAKRIYGYEPAELLGHYFTELETPEQAQKDLAVFARIKSGENFFHYETEHRHQDGTAVFLSFNAMVIRDEHGGVRGTTGTATDITQRKHLEAERRNMDRKLLETQKLESLGVLAGGIAHDFNNLLTGILGNAGLARMDLPEQSSVHPFLEQIETASLRAADLCKQMLAYSGKGRFQVRRLNLNALVEETTELLKISINKKAALHLQLSPDLPAVTADSAQMHQVIMNLVINASEAIGEQPGVITLRTECQRVDPDFLRDAYMAPDLPPGEYVCLEVTDNGCGMSGEIQARIFDPFFTTKFTGRGLGLAAVLGIVHSHGGALKVSSEPGRGTTFKMLLLRVAGLAEAAGTVAGAAPVWQGTGTVLVVDDEPAVRAVVELVLKAAGFEVVFTADGAEGVARFREQPGEFVVVLMDLTMPRLDGAEAFREIRKIRADARVLLMSGFSEQDALNRFTGQGLAGFIQKPFKIATLLEKLREVLS